MIKRLYLPALLGLAFIAYPVTVKAEDHSLRIRQIMASPVTLERALVAGKRAAFLCVHCHGETGESVHANIPNLAGQNPVYLLTQIEKFGDGRRQDEFMSGLIRVLKPDDRINMAIYFAAQSVVPAKVKDAALVSMGGQIYSRLCTKCHGLQGYGERHIARLAGQHPEYITQSLERYRKGTKERSDPLMGSIARQLKDQDIAALASFISTMK